MVHHRLTALALRDGVDKLDDRSPLHQMDWQWTLGNHRAR